MPPARAPFLQVVDRPTQGHRFLSREYVQPQWVFDSANFRVLAKPSLYAPGKPLPPHLSPFVNAEEEGYVPEYGRQLAALQEAARTARRRRAAAAAGGDVFVGEEGEGANAAGGGALTAEEEMEAAEARYAAELAKELKVGPAGAEAGHAGGAAHPLGAGAGWRRAQHFTQGPACHAAVHPYTTCLPPCAAAAACPPVRIPPCPCLCRRAAALLPLRARGRRRGLLGRRRAASAAPPRLTWRLTRRP